MTVTRALVIALKNTFTTTVLFFINSIAIAAIGDKPIAYINTKPVEVAELKREMLHYRSAVYSEYATKFDLSKINDFWNANLGGKKPIDSLRYRALKALI